MSLHTVKQSGTLARFRTAQDKQWPRIAREIATGKKETHWMWFVFPQLRVFAKSETAYYYGIADQQEALAYLDEDTLRVRLATATQGMLRQNRLMFSDVDRRKLHRCMTLFGELVKDRTLPDAVLAKHFGGTAHQPTLDALAGRPVTVPNQWTPQRLWSAQGHVEVRGKAKADMGRHWEKQIQRARDTVRAVGQRQARAANDPMDSTEVESFLKGFGLTSAQVRAISREWIADQTRAHTQGWEAADEEAWFQS